MRTVFDEELNGLAAAETSRGSVPNSRQIRVRVSADERERQRNEEQSDEAHDSATMTTLSKFRHAEFEHFS